MSMTAEQLQKMQEDSDGMMEEINARMAKQTEPDMITKKISENIGCYKDFITQNKRSRVDYRRYRRFWQHCTIIPSSTILLLKPLAVSYSFGVYVECAAQKAGISKDNKSTEASIRSWLKRFSERMSAASNKN
ncbi:hypothetical protein JTB14_009674 [Gonioctena quinquepunctata]|nr:hypothetical protein JTB14_009674 [Gonioctena quinquepunctata]